MNASIQRCRAALTNRAWTLRVALAKKRWAGRSFSLISNNCWGAHVYQILDLQYSTPFVGLFIRPTSYFRLLAEFPQCLSLPLKFKTTSDEAWVNQARETHTIPWPIGSLGDRIEIQFMHYKSETEAREKWQRRCARFVVQPERWFFKLCDGHHLTSEETVLFDQLPFRNKVFFTTRRDCSLRCAVSVPSNEHGGALSRISPAYFDTIDWINGGSGHVRWWWRWLNCV
jgi:uncharacterized protein (DUF1919 family)